MRDRLDGVESKGHAPTLYLQRIAATLRKPPAKPVTSFKAFKESLGIKLSRSRHNQVSVTAWLQENIGRAKIDHYMPITLETGDMLVLVQPYDHPDETDLKTIETRGGYVVHPNPQWGFLHTICLPDAYLIPAKAITNFVS